MHTKLIIRAVFGTIGNFISFGLFASPVPTFYRVIKNNSVKELKPEYYLAMTMNCLFWVLYGMPVINPGYILVLTANGIGLVIYFAYLIIFILYAKHKKQRMYVGGVFLIELAVVGLVSGLMIGLAHTFLTRTVLVGGFCFLFGTVMYAPRIFLMVQVCTEKSVESMPFFVALSNTLNDLCWLIYASLGFEHALWFTYCTGFSVGVLQLVLHGVYYKSTSGDDNKVATAEVQLRGICVVDDKKLATDDSSNKLIQVMDDKKLATAQVQL